MSPADAAEAPPDLGRMRLAEFIALMAVTVSVVALSIDAMLPSLGAIAADLRLVDPADRQLVITAFIAGLSIGPVVFGVAADAFGRRPAMFAGLAVFALGCALSAVATDLTLLLLGRALAGFGAAAPRILAMAIVRDRFDGRRMAQVTSYIMSVFILVPALAPMLGLGVASFGGWRLVFWMLLALGLALWLWLALRLPETLAPERRRPIALALVASGFAAALGDRVALGWMLATGCVFGGFLSYLASSQHMIGEIYGFGDGFVLVFGALALTIGAASVVSGRLVMRLGQRPLAMGALAATVGLAALALGVQAALGGAAPAWLFLGWAAATFFAFGLMFGNLNALAMAPLGALAGLGAALTATVANLVSVPIALVIGARLDDGPTALFLGMLLCGLGAIGFARWAARDETPATAAAS